MTKEKPVSGPISLTMYRVTQNRCYPQGTPGYTNCSARQGHYIEAVDIHEAGKIARERRGLTGSLTVQYWDKDLYENGELIIKQGAVLGFA